MVKLNSLLLVILLSLSLSFAKNYPYAIVENSDLYLLSQDSKSIYAIETLDSSVNLKSIELSTGKLLSVKKISVPPFSIGNIALVDGVIYLYTFKIIDRKSRSFVVNIYTLDSKSGKATTIYTTKETQVYAEKMVVMGKSLLLMEKRGNNAFLFNTEKKSMQRVKMGEDFKILLPITGKNSALVADWQGRDIHNKSYNDEYSVKVGDGSPIDLYYMDLSNGFKLTKIGEFQPSFSSTATKVIDQSAHLIIKDSSFTWVDTLYPPREFPIKVYELIANKELYKRYLTLDGFERIDRVNVVGDTYLIANRYGEEATKNIVLYNLKTPITKRPSTVSNADVAAVKKLLSSGLRSEYTLIDPKMTDPIVSGKLYSVKVINEQIDTSEDGSISSMSSVDKFIAYGSEGKYSAVKDASNLVSMVKKGYLLTDKSAIAFQALLDILFPMSSFDQDKKSFKKSGDSWIFTRGEHFGKMSGIVVKVNSSGKILSIEKKREL